MLSYGRSPASIDIFDIGDVEPNTRFVFAQPLVEQMSTPKTQPQQSSSPSPTSTIHPESHRNRINDLNEQICLRNARSHGNPLRSCPSLFHRPRRQRRIQRQTSPTILPHLFISSKSTTSLQTTLCLYRSRCLPHLADYLQRIVHEPPSFHARHSRNGLYCGEYHRCGSHKWALGQISAGVGGFDWEG